MYENAGLVLNVITLLVLIISIGKYFGTSNQIIEQIKVTQNKLDLAILEHLKSDEIRFNQLQKDIYEIKFNIDHVVQKELQDYIPTSFFNQYQNNHSIEHERLLEEIALLRPIKHEIPNVKTILEGHEKRLSKLEPK